MVPAAARLNSNGMDDVARLIGLFEDSGVDSAWKLDALLDLGQQRDPRIIPLLLRVLSDPAEATAVGVAVIRSLRDRRLDPTERPLVARALTEVVGTSPGTESDVRAQAALALGDFVALDGVVEVLGDRAADPQDHFAVRYFAFTSLERAGPTVEAVGILTRLRTDDTLGRSAQSLLNRWRIEQ